MIRHLIIFSAFCAFFVSSVVNIGPAYPPTKGAVWPKPQYEQKQNMYFVHRTGDFRMWPTNYTCPLLVKAMERYAFLVRSLQNIVRRSRKYASRRKTDNTFDINYKGVLKELQITLKSPCEDYPYFGMDESYSLWVDQTSVLTSNSIWGILRGFETWTALFYLSDDYVEVRINKTDIEDFPRYKHRGLLLDTSRHYISVLNILKTLNAMSMNKMNVFHWHIVDDQSFPYESQKFPELSKKGAYHRTMVYSRMDIKSVIEYARDRGIRVIPEFDVPGHTRSWGEAYPSLLTECYSGKTMTGLGPMNPTRNSTYDFLQILFNEIQSLFPEKYIHIGGDEVELYCWQSNEEVRNFMTQNNLTVEQLHRYFMQKVIPLLNETSKAIVWQEVFDEAPLAKDIIVQVWKGDEIPEMVKVLEAGNKLIFSSSWYLDHLKTGGDWVDFYKADPRAMVVNQLNDVDLLDNIIGGEACMWGEVVNDANVISRVWPRASAVAEKLWSAAVSSPRWHYKAEKVQNRLEEHTCRMNRRGIAAQPPNGPGVCVTNSQLDWSRL